MDAAYGIGNMKPHEFWSSTPGELTPYVESRAKWMERDMRIENQRVGVICATIANVNRDPKQTPRAYTADDFISLSTDAKKRDPIDPQAFFDRMNKIARS